MDLSDGPEWPHFFAGGRLNLADFAVDRWVREGFGADRAIWWEGDDGTRRTLTYAELKEQVDAAAGALRQCGVVAGDAVGLLLPMIPEAGVTLLAAAKLGAMVVPIFSGYGPPAIRERLEHSGAKVLVTCDGFPRRGQVLTLKAQADRAIAGLDSVQHVLVVRRLGLKVDMQPGRDRYWDEPSEPVTTALPVDSETPCLLLYTSGSTGRPKACVHTHAGLPLRLAQEARHGFGIEPGQTMLWQTDMGWVMGTFLFVTTLVNRATAAVFEGTPDWPEPDRLWAVAQRSGANILGVGPTLVRALMSHGDELPRRYELPNLRAIGSTGEPWNLEPWLWCFRNVGREAIPIINVSGGTECGASILTGNVFSPVKPMAFCGPALGMASDVVDDDGNPVRERIGELVVRQPWPGMTKGFWREPPERYVNTYWSRYPGLWQQGDLAYIDRDGFWYVLGRSDDVIKVGGKRIGPAELESALCAADEVVEAAAVGIPDDVKGEAIVCFVVFRAGTEDPEASAQRMLEEIGAAFGKPMRPRAVHAVPALPKTRSGKILRRLLSATYLGRDLGDISSCEDPSVLEHVPRMAGVS
jgi:acetyl-CoA synthetase